MNSQTAEEIKRHFDIVAEGLRSEIRAVAEGVAATNERFDRLEGRMEQEFPRWLGRTLSFQASDSPSLRSLVAAK
jgi:hypothetical protein